jgi:hypothetical protein
MEDRDAEHDADPADDAEHPRGDPLPIQSLSLPTTSMADVSGRT